MKNFKQFLSKPKFIIPAFAILAAVIVFFALGHIGQAPTIPVSITQEPLQAIVDSNGNSALSFPKSGRVEAVLVKEGDSVAEGQVLARLSAPDQRGAIIQAKGALDLAEAEYASLNVEYKDTKAQQDLLVAHSYQTLLSSSLEGTSNVQDANVPVISGTYTCNKEGSYTLKAYTSGDTDSGYSINYSGLESGTLGVKYDNPVPLGTCGLQIKFAHAANFNPLVVWTIAIPNTKSSTYLANKNAYDLAVNTREKILTELATNVGTTTEGTSVAKAKVDAARGAYELALGAYESNVITAPRAGVITFVDPNLKVGQSVTANKSVISINSK